MPNWPDGWWFEVRPATTAITLALQSGAGKDAPQIWSNWHRDLPVRSPFPDEQQGLSHLFVEVINPEEEHVEVDVFYNGQLRQCFVFSNTHEWHEIDGV